MTRTTRYDRPRAAILGLAGCLAALLAAPMAAAEAPKPQEQAQVPAASKSAKAKSAPGRAAEQRVELSVTADGFVPDTVKVKVGVPVRLVVTRKVERTCADSIVIKDYDVSTPLPVGKAVEVTLTPKKAGDIRYACSMDMIAGKLVAE